MSCSSMAYIQQAVQRTSPYIFCNVAGGMIDNNTEVLKIHFKKLQLLQR